VRNTSQLYECVNYQLSQGAKGTNFANKKLFQKTKMFLFILLALFISGTNGKSRCFFEKAMKIEIVKLGRTSKVNSTNVVKLFGYLTLIALVNDTVYFSYVYYYIKSKNSIHYDGFMDIPRQTIQSQK